MAAESASQQYRMRRPHLILCPLMPHHTPLCWLLSNILQLTTHAHCLWVSLTEIAIIDWPVECQLGTQRGTTAEQFHPLSPPLL
ncbi:uncharacterized protein BDV14DRAFT_177269 [Aspergillus stella-maris]|uniref:uncharacterized protein n=1 Tax=Aspergillus stella-maris TaxID=1810926 RepID=UPI003CCCBF88